MKTARNEQNQVDNQTEVNETEKDWTDLNIKWNNETNQTKQLFPKNIKGRRKTGNKASPWYVKKCVKNILCPAGLHSALKGTVAREFLVLVFFIKLFL